MEDVESIVKRLQATHKGVIGVIIARGDGMCLHSTMPDADTARILDMVVKISSATTDAVKNSKFDPNASKDKEKMRPTPTTAAEAVVNPVDMIRVNTILYDIIIGIHPEYLFITLQHPDAAKLSH